MTRPDVASELLFSVANKLLNKTVFGDGFNTTFRNAPALTIRRDYIVMYDSSEI